MNCATSAATSSFRWFFGSSSVIDAAAWTHRTLVLAFWGLEPIEQRRDVHEASHVSKIAPRGGGRAFIRRPDGQSFQVYPALPTSTRWPVVRAPARARPTNLAGRRPSTSA